MGPCPAYGLKYATMICKIFEICNTFDFLYFENQLIAALRSNNYLKYIKSPLKLYKTRLIISLPLATFIKIIEATSLDFSIKSLSNKLYVSTKTASDKVVD